MFSKFYKNRVALFTLVLLIFLTAFYLIFSHSRDKQNRENQKDSVGTTASSNESNSENRLILESSQVSTNSLVSNTEQNDNFKNSSTETFSSVPYIYRNSNFPSLRINYNENWSFSKESLVSYIGISGEKISLKKNDTLLVFALEPQNPGKCGYGKLGIDPTIKNDDIILKDSIARYRDLTVQNRFLYGPKDLNLNSALAYYNCLLTPANSSLKLNSIFTNQAYQTFFPNENVTMGVSIIIETTNSDELQEAENIILNSSFFDFVAG